jgi:small-conductance mechanosensitive channel
MFGVFKIEAPLVLFAQAKAPTTAQETLTPTNIILVFLTFLVVWLLLRYLAIFFNAISNWQPRARFLIKVVEPVIRVFLWFAAFISAALKLSPDYNAFLAAVGSAALAIGLGAQDLIKSLIGGLVILADRPYQLGDRVRMGEAYGEIDHIGLRSTKLTTPDDTRVTIPNSEILNNKAFNANSGVPDCQVVTEVFLPPDTDPSIAWEIGHQAALTSPFTYLAKPITVLLVDSYTESPFLTLRVKAYVFDHRYEPKMQSDIVKRCKREFLGRGLLEKWKEMNF